MKHIGAIALAYLLAAGSAAAEGMSAETHLFDHKGSTVEITTGSEVHITYVFPRPGLPANVSKGTILFDGYSEVTLVEGDFLVRTENVSGTAYAFSTRCGAIPYHVSGQFTPNGEALILRGAAPVLDPGSCRVLRYDWRSREGTLPFVRDDRPVGE